MAKKICLFIFPLLLFSFSPGERIELHGVFLGKNLYVVNPFTGTGVGYCIYEITVNGQTTSDEINSSAFEIDLSQFNLSIGEKISVVLRYKNDCVPKIINPEVIQPKSSFELKTAKVDKQGVLHWATHKELGSLPFVVQQFRWNKWITIGEVAGMGQLTLNKYHLKVRPHSGKNKFRVCQTDYTGNTRHSSVINYVSTISPVSFASEKIKEDLFFSDTTLYEIYDSYGNIVFKGYGDKIKLKGLHPGLYYINYDNVMDSFLKK